MIALRGALALRRQFIGVSCLPTMVQLLVRLCGPGF